ncbi:MAG: hypothetical protein WD709_01915 [Gammaproteobacteria bacterium]
MPEDKNQLITDVDVREFFQGAVQSAISNQHLTISGETTLYLGNLLTSFVCSERLYDTTSDGVMLKPLAQHYLEALEAGSVQERILILRRLGDISLFISGLFAQSLKRSLVDVDYYIAMGGNAYSCLSDTNNRSALTTVFAELSQRFIEMVDVLSEVGETANLANNNDVLRLYEIWLKSGSKRAGEKLRQIGIHPVRTRLDHH